MVTDNQTPAQTPTQGTNPQDELAAIKAKIEEMKAQKEAAKGAVEDKFFAKEEELLPPEIVELKYSSNPADKKQYQKALEQAKAEFEAKELEPHDLQIAALEDAYEKKANEIDEATKQKAIDDGRAAFLAAHPEVDFAKLSEFWMMDTTEREKKAIADATPPGDIKGFYEAVYELMQKETAEAPEEQAEQPQEKLPPQFDSNSVPAKEPIKGGGDAAYLAAIGVR